MPVNNVKYGWKPQLPDWRDYKLVHAASAIAARPRHFDLTPRMPFIYDQGQLGSCVGNSVAGAIHYNVLKQKLGTWKPSRLFLYFNARFLEGTADSDSGCMVRDGIKGAVKWGVPHDYYWPYDINQFDIAPPQNVYLQAEKNVVTSYVAVPQTVDDICTTLASGEPVVFGFSVYDDFESDAVAQTGVLNMPTRGEQILGGHSVLLVGYDDDMKRFKVRNSWGLHWGMNGYFTMPYDYVASRDLSSDFWVVRTIK